MRRLFGLQLPLHQRRHRLSRRGTLVKNAINLVTDRHLDAELIRDFMHGFRRLDALDDLLDFFLGLLHGLAAGDREARAASFQPGRD